MKSESCPFACMVVGWAVANSLIELIKFLAATQAAWSPLGYASPKPAIMSSGSVVLWTRP